MNPSSGLILCHEVEPGILAICYMMGRDFHSGCLLRSWDPGHNTEGMSLIFSKGSHPHVFKDEMRLVEQP